MQLQNYSVVLVVNKKMCVLVFFYWGICFSWNCKSRVYRRSNLLFDWHWDISVSKLRHMCCVYLCVYHTSFRSMFLSGCFRVSEWIDFSIHTDAMSLVCMCVSINGKMILKHPKTHEENKDNNTETHCEMVWCVFLQTFLMSRHLPNWKNNRTPCCNACGMPINNVIDYILSK